MTLRTRLTLWYGLLVAAVLSAALSVAYVQHVGGHLQDLERRAPTMEPAAVAEARARLDAMAEQQRSEFTLIALAGLAVALAGGWLIGRSALRPVAMITETARAIADSGEFSRRVPSIDQRDEIGLLARTFDEMLDSLDAAYHVQQRFLADASHELRTPLSTIQGSAEILGSGDADAAERAEALARIARESRRMSRLVDDLLVLARADAGAEPMRAQDVALDEVVMEAFDELRPVAGRRLRVTALEEVVVRGERDRLKQLVMILLDNALRYTPGDGRIEVTVVRDGARGLIRVDDEGIGLTPAVAGRAFERFYRGEAARRADPAGTGLGLSIARWIVDRHGGAIALQPRTGRGTSAVVRLPSAAGDPVPADAHAAVSSAERRASQGSSAHFTRAG